MIYPLNSLSAIACKGDNTQTFLQGQLTCDVNTLTASGHYSLAACCDHKGRMIANFWVVRRKNDFLFILPNDLRGIVIAHLQKYAVFSKVILSSDDSIKIYAADDITVDTLKQSLNPDAIVITLPNVKRHLIFNTSVGCDTPKDDSNWLAENVNDGFALLSQNTSLLFTPQMIGLERQGGVSFTKGCYVGQEIVARTQHLGKLKRHLHHIQFTHDRPLQAGDSLLNDQGEKIGVIVNALYQEDKVNALAVIEDHALESIRKHVF